MSGGQRLARGPRELPLRALSVGAGLAVPMGTGGTIGTSCHPLLSGRRWEDCDISP